MHTQQSIFHKHYIHGTASQSRAGELVSGETSPLTISTSEVAKQPLALMTGNDVRLLRQQIKKTKQKPSQRKTILLPTG